MDTTKVDFIVRHALKNRLHHHLEHDPGQRGADAAVRPEPERDVTIRRPVEYHFVGPVELPLVVVGRKPADEHLVVAPKSLSAKYGVATYRTAQCFVNRAVPEKLIRRGAIQRGLVDELLSQIWMRAEVQQAQRGQ